MAFPLNPAHFVTSPQDDNQPAKSPKPAHPISPEALQTDPISTKLWTPSDFEAINKILTRYSPIEESQAN